MNATLHNLQAYIDAQYAHYDDDNHVFLARLDPVARVAVLVQRLDGQVNNGGFAQWISNGYADCLKETVAALQDIATDAALVAAGLVRLAEDKAREYAERRRGEEVDLDALDVLDDQFYAIEAALVNDLAMYVAAHA